MRLIILGRDGVINERTEREVSTPEQWRPIPGSLAAIARLTYAHYHIVVITNQPGLATGTLKVGDLHLIHRKMLNSVAEQGGHIDAILYCPHRAEDHCNCRKPRPGLFLEVAKRLGVSLAGVPVIGAMQVDVQAARAVGARPMLIHAPEGCGEDLECYESLEAAVDTLLEEDRGDHVMA